MKFVIILAIILVLTQLIQASSNCCNDDSNCESSCCSSCRTSCCRKKCNSCESKEKIEPEPVADTVIHHQTQSEPVQNYVNVSSFNPINMTNSLTNTNTIHIPINITNYVVTHLNHTSTTSCVSACKKDNDCVNTCNSTVTELEPTTCLEKCVYHIKDEESQNMCAINCLPTREDDNSIEITTPKSEENCFEKCIKATQVQEYQRMCLKNCMPKEEKSCLVKCAEAYTNEAEQLDCVKKTCIKEKVPEKTCYEQCLEENPNNFLAQLNCAQKKCSLTKPDCNTQIATNCNQNCMQSCIPRFGWNYCNGACGASQCNQCMGSCSQYFSAQYCQQSCSKPIQSCPFQCVSHYPIPHQFNCPSGCNRQYQTRMPQEMYNQYNYGK